MRISPLVLVLGVTASTMSVAGLAQRQPVDPASAALVKQAEELMAQGKLVEADDTLEAALVIDPKNEDAFTAMAKVAIEQRLYGQAISYGRKALIIDPTDRAALAVQGEALVQIGATDRAQQNLAKLAELCGNDCAERTKLAAAIRRGPVLAAAETPDAPQPN